MNREPPHTADPTAPPQRIAALLHVVRILLGYGRHLADTVRDRAAAPGFPTIAACFGTLDLAVILARLHRGILRAVALERVLLARATRGRDIAFARARVRTHGRTSEPAGAAANQRSAARKPRRVLADVHTPTLQELERQVRRRPLGRTIADICLDLAVVPGFCTGSFWNELFDAIHWHGGSLGTMLRERYRREQAFHRQQDRRPTRGCDLWDQRRNAPSQVLGFFIGEQPVHPLPPPGNRNGRHWTAPASSLTRGASVPADPPRPPLPRSGEGRGAGASSRAPPSSPDQATFPVQ